MSRFRFFSLILLAAVTAFFVFFKFSGTRVSKHSRDERLEKLRSLPYLSFTNKPVNSLEKGVVLYKPENAYDGYNIYCSRISSEAFLMNMKGEIIHRWYYPQEGDDVWDYVLMLDNGDLIVIHKFRELLRLDWNSDLVWKKKMEVHHDVLNMPDGSFYVLSQEIRENYRGVNVVFPLILHLNDSGDIIDRWSSYNHLDEIRKTFDTTSFLDTIFDQGGLMEGFERYFKHYTKKIAGMRVKNYDYFHINTVSIVPENDFGGEDSRFAKGNFLICFRNVNQIAILDRIDKRVKWTWGEGILEWPHHPTMLSSGNILVFDNGIKRKYSKVLEVNPVEKKIVWEYVGRPPKSFFSAYKGSAQRLSNGNTLICEGNKGCVFEVTPGGEIVWRWFNPVVRNKKRQHVYRMIRIPSEKIERLLISKR